MENIRCVANLRKTSTVTRLPGWILKIKGRLDSRRGKAVCDEYIQRLYKKLASLESNEVIDAESKLYRARKEAAIILVRFSEERRFLSGIVRLTAINEEIISADVVMNERIHEMHNKAAEKIHAYIVGIRCGQLSDYECEIKDVSDNARVIYRNRHEELDRKIQAAIGNEMNEEKTA